ncbi:MAG: cyclic nucleotide-binding domain-containing protein [Mariprofundales bacterium]|nr:cyclic nucleotide-binding domain-containing protein [Mariprofundales bacterium]
MDDTTRILPIYRDMLSCFPDDLHLARPMIILLQQRGERELAAKLSMHLARRMRKGARYGEVLNFLTMAKHLGYPDSEEVQDLQRMAEALSIGVEQGVVDTGRVFGLVEALSDQEVRTFLLDGTPLEVKQGCVVVMQGEVSQTFFLILHGEMDVELTTDHGVRVKLATLKAGEYFGEFACVYQMQRSATVRAGSDARLLQFSDQTIQNLIDHAPIAGEQLMQVVQRRMISNLTYEHPAFAELSLGDRAWLADSAKVRVFQPGENVCQDASSSNQWLIVISGKIERFTRLKLAGDVAVGTMVCGASKSLRRQETILRAKSQSLVCDAPVEIFASFMKTYDGFLQWVRAQAEV